MARRMVEMEIEGMSCRRCAEYVAAAIKNVNVQKVVKATVDLQSNWALVTVDDPVTNQDLIAAVKAAGYGARLAGQ